MSTLQLLCRSFKPHVFASGDCLWCAFLRICRDFFYKSSNPTVGIILLLGFIFSMVTVLLNCLIGAGQSKFT